MKLVLFVAVCCTAISFAYAQAECDHAKFAEKAKTVMVECKDEKEACLVKCGFEKMELIGTDNKLKSEVTECMKKVTDDKIPEDKKECVNAMKKCVEDKGASIDASQGCKGFQEMYDCVKPMLDKMKGA